MSATLSRLLDRIRHTLGTGTTKTAAQDAGGVQTAQVKFNDLDVRDNVPLVYFFGFSASPPVGTEIVVVAPQGDPSSAVGIASNNQALRPRNLQPGEAILYDSLGRSVKLSAAGGIVIEAATSPVTVNDATTVTINAATGVNITTPTVAVTGNITATGDITAGFGTGNQVGVRTHKHTQPNDSHGDTEQPTAAPTAGS